MDNQKVIFLTSISLLIAVFAGKSISRVSRINRAGDSFASSNQMRNMSPGERRRAFEDRRREYAERSARRRDQRRIEREKQLREVRATAGKRSEESLKQAIGATQEQWKVIGPKFRKVQALMREARVSITPITYGTGGSSGRGSRSSYREGTGRYGGTAGGSGGAGGRGGAGGSRSASGRGRAGGSSTAGGGGGVGGIGGAGSRGGIGGSGGAGGISGAEGSHSIGGEVGQKPPKDTSREEIRNWNESGWKWLRPSERKSTRNMTKGDRTCEELLDLLQNKNANPELIKQKLDTLRNIRQKAEMQLIKAQQELRKVLTPRQQALFVLMGWLD